MKYLVAVDVQKEFVRDNAGTIVYNKCLKYINNAKENGYDTVIALCYQQDNVFQNMKRMLNWNEMHKIKPLEFNYNIRATHSGYAVNNYFNIDCYDKVDIIGFDTDACVLATAFEIFNRDCDMRILSNLCYSSGGHKLHQAALQIMNRQFGKALDTTTDVEVNDT